MWRAVLAVVVCFAALGTPRASGSSLRLYAVLGAGEPTFRDAWGAPDVAGTQERWVRCGDSFALAILVRDGVAVGVARRRCDGKAVADPVALGLALAPPGAVYTGRTGRSQGASLRYYTDAALAAGIPAAVRARRIWRDCAGRPVPVGTFAVASAGSAVLTILGGCYR